jgi:hypothetical protein
LPRRDNLAAEGWTLDSLGVLRIRHEASREVRVVGGP